MSRRLADRARKAAKSRLLPQEARHRVFEEIRGHLEDVAEGYESLGMSRRQAERLALRDFGDAKKVRTDIGRAFRGHRTVLFPEAPGEGSRSFLIYDARVILAILCLVFLLRWQVVQAYHIPTKSMEPTLHGDPRHGDKILVNKLYFHLFHARRWQVAVFADDEEDRNLIKRIVGLPGETIRIENGDIYADGEIQRKPWEVEEDLLVPVYRRGRDVSAKVRGITSTGLESWDAVGTWAEVHRGFYAEPDEEGHASLAWGEPVYNDIPGDAPGAQLVGDLVLGFSVTPGEGAATVVAALREGRDKFELRIPVGAGDTELRRNKKLVARASGVFLTGKESSHVLLANLDDLVRVEIDGVEAIRYDVPDASTAGADPEFHPPAEFGIQGAGGLFTGVDLARDIHYLDEGGPFVVPEDHYFMLGDNSANSHDSRTSGPVHESRLIGRPIWVILPLSRVKTVR